MARKKKATKDKGISRIDSGSTHGWFVRGYRNGKTFSRLFSDQKCGSKTKALGMAREYRDELYKELDEIPRQPRARRIVFSDRRNSTGVLGVCRTAKRSPNGTLNECYSVSWRPAPGVQKCTSFSIRKYGEKGAFDQAVAHRRKMMREIHEPQVVKQMELNEKPAVVEEAPVVESAKPAKTKRAKKASKKAAKKATKKAAAKKVAAAKKTTSKKAAAKKAPAKKAAAKKAPAKKAAAKKAPAKKAAAKKAPAKKAATKKTAAKKAAKTKKK